MSSPPPAEPPARLQSVSQLTSRPLAWLWPGRLALGKLAILDGDPGLGKSLLTLDLCARLSTGRPFPDGSPGPGPASSLVLNAEDGAEDTIRPRLQALAADLDRVFILEREADAGGPLRFPADIPLLDDALARKHHCVLLLVRHLNKNPGRRSLYRGGGSIGFVGACRSAWLIAPDPHAPGRRVLAQVKNNLAPPQPSLAYSVSAPEGAPPTLSWLGPSPWAADQLLARAGLALPRGVPRERARDFLADFLEERPRTSVEVLEAGRENGLTRRTLHRARDELEVRTLSVWAGGKRLSYWLLPHQELPEGARADPDEVELENMFAALRKQYPPSSDVDDV